MKSPSIVRSLCLLLGISMAACCASQRAGVSRGGEGAVDRFQAWVEALNAKDSQKLTTFYAADSVATLIDSGEQHRGPEAAIHGFDPLWSAFPDMTWQPQLVLVRENRVFAIMLLRGTNTGDLFGRPATGKSVGVLGAIAIETDESGKFVKETHYANPMIAFGQMGMGPEPHPAPERAWDQRPVVIATDSAGERAGVKRIDDMQSAFDQRNFDAMFESVAEDYAFHGRMMRQLDASGKDKLKEMTAEMLKMTSDMKQSTSAWSAGDYVVNFVRSTGTLDGDLPSEGIRATGKKYDFSTVEIFRFEGDKIREHWAFGNGMSFATQVGLTGPPEEPKEPASVN